MWNNLKQINVDQFLNIERKANPSYSIFYQELLPQRIHTNAII